MALAGIARLVGEDARHEAADRVRHRHGGELAAGQHKVAEGELLVHACLDEALVNALVVTADEHKVVIVPREGARLGLVEGGTLRA